MKRSFFFLIALGFSFLHAVGEELEHPPGSSLWDGFYDPLYITPTEIPTANPLRKELFNQLRDKLEPRAGQPILFSGSLKAYRNWALFLGETQDREGNSFAYPEHGNSDTVALWLRTVEGWKIVDYDAGHSDALFVVWPEVYGMPKAFFKK